MADLIGQRLGNYQVTALLGEGGMAAVYRARQVNIDRDVAIKVIDARLARNPEFIRRFEREARTIASLNHAHILKLFDYGQHDDAIYLVMELLMGGSLAAQVRRGPLPAERVAGILDQIASALDYAHQKGIIHRDLKPQNVLFDEAGQAHLTDFGIAKIVNEGTSLTMSGMTMGTPMYMAPEQWQGADLDARSDVYALGVMLYEMLSGQAPFLADTPASLMYKHLQETPPPLQPHRPDLPAGIEAVLIKALAKNRDRRFSSAGDVAAAFRLAL
ncbi:MAG: serine/threonine protein kinase, partial [Anaerolineae bacterium]|nr:serine/threonine protein kinase [Anaerolineae bacterium]